MLSYNELYVKYRSNCVCVYCIAYVYRSICVCVYRNICHWVYWN